MSYSTAELQAMFDDMTMLVAEIIPSFKVDALRYLNGSIEFKEFEQNYGEGAGKFLLKIAQKFNKATEDIQLKGMEAFAAQALNGFSADDIAPIIEHWIKNRPSIFQSFLHQYPRVFLFVHRISHFEMNESGRLSRNALAELDHLTDAVNEYQPSCSLSAEYLGAKKADTTEHDTFRQSANWSLTTMLSVAELLRSKDNSLEVYRVEGSISLEPDLVKDEQEKRQQKREQGATQAVEFLKQIKQEELSGKVINSRSTPEQIAEYNKIALELAILEGKKSFGHERLKISVILDVDPSKMSASQRLETVDNLEALRVKQAYRLLHEASTWMQERMTKLSQDIKRKPKQAKMEAFQDISEMDAIARGEPTYRLSPEADSKGEMHFGETPMQEGKTGINEKLKLLGARIEQSKITSKAISALMDFIDVLRHLPTLIETPKLRRTQSVPNLPRKSDETSSLRKRSLSSSAIMSQQTSDYSQLVAASSSWFAPAKPKPTNADIGLINKIVSMVPRLRIPGTRST